MYGIVVYECPSLPHIGSVPAVEQEDRMYYVAPSPRLAEFSQLSFPEEFACCKDHGVNNPGHSKSSTHNGTNLGQKHNDVKR